ncbi:hypothetical protein BB170200_03122 [Mycobacterium marinum]|nr:hypothetical protein BB170200_03122 [Mycobacterium marinum]
MCWPLADRYRVPTFPRSEAALAVDLKSADWMGLEQMTRAPALLISRLVSWVDDLWCRAIGAGV